MFMFFSEYLVIAFSTETTKNGCFYSRFILYKFIKPSDGALYQTAF